MHRTGLEPVTTRFEAGYSIRLSYRCEVGIVTHMTILEKTEGIVLRSLDYKERERIVTLFTKEAGLISLIIKGLSKKNFHLLSLSTPFCCAEFIYTKGRSDLYRFQDGSLLEGYPLLRTKWNHLKTAASLTQNILHSQLPGKSAPLLYALFNTCLKQIAHFEDPAPLVASFTLKLLAHEGLIATTQLPTLFQELLATRSFEHLKQLCLSPEQCHEVQELFKLSLLL